jgi:hypothetical protein
VLTIANPQVEIRIGFSVNICNNMRSRSPELQTLPNNAMYVAHVLIIAMCSIESCDSILLSTDGVATAAVASNVDMFLIWSADWYCRIIAIN